MPPRKYDELSPTELKVLQHAANGLTMRETAEATKRSQNTINSQRDMILRKLQARNIAHAVAIGLRQELID